MKICLVRHGEALPSTVHPERSLTRRGREEAKRTANALLEKTVEAGAIFHSGKLRTRQTAEILAETLASAKPPEYLEGLEPEDDPRRTARWIEARATSAILVGHLPHLGLLTALLTARDGTGPDIHFPTAGACSLERRDGIWRLAWTIAP